MPIGGLLRTIQSSLNGVRPEGELRRQLQHWKSHFSVPYGSDLAKLRARLDRILDGQESDAKVLTTPDCTKARKQANTHFTYMSDRLCRAPKPSAAKSRSEAIEFLVKSAAEAWQLVPVGRPLKLSHTIPQSLLSKLPPNQALNALIRITQALIGEYGYQKDHPARYATLRPGFAKSRELAPEFSTAVRSIFDRLQTATDKQLVDLFTPLYVGWKKRFAANKLIETFHLANLNRPLLFAMFRTTMESDNAGTDCPTWGDSFEPLEDEAEGPQPLVLLPGDAWSNAALAALKEMNPSQRDAWLNLLKPSDSVEWSRPPKTWLKNAAASVAAIPDFSETLSSWLSLVGKRGTRVQNLWAWPPDGTYIRYRNQRTLRALIWAATTAPTHELAAAIGDTAVACDQKVLRLGPRSEIVRNAAIAALAAMPASIAGPQVTKVSLLAKYKTSKKLSTRAVQAAVDQNRVSIPEFMEIAVPTYNFKADHTTTLPGGATLRITGGAKVQTTSEESPREVREIERLLTAHRVRIERLLIADRSWPLATWRERYGDHPLLSYMCRRLIWTLGDNSGLWNGKSWLNSSGKSLAAPKTVRPWHPASQEPADVLAWRKALESMELIQPFKQAHREIYLLTDAERATRTYSNRFAAHIIRGPQFRSLMRERGWGGDPVIAFDTSMSPASLDLPDAGLSTIFSTSPADEEADSRGFFRHVATDRVEFHRDGQPISLEQVPSLTFTEVMRDIDLFVGVASVGNNPEWHDGGPDGRFRQYWWTYGIADLSASGITRRDLLSRLLPRLKLASTCSLTDKFLTVRGHLRTYKIHLGSANIFMEPNDQYLCIVPGRGDQPSEVMLPFEGDRTLAIILSKAFMLAEDDKISDPTITRQIKPR